MEENYNNYSVVFKVRNKESKAWASKLVWSGSDEREGWSQYYAEQSRLTGSKDFDVVQVYLLNEFGLVESKLLDERMLEQDQQKPKETVKPVETEEPQK